MCGPCVWNALHIRLPVEKYLTSQHCTPHVVWLATQASCYTGIKESHANRQWNNRLSVSDLLRVKIVGNISDADGMLFSYDWVDSIEPQLTEEIPFTNLIFPSEIMIQRQSK